MSDHNPYHIITGAPSTGKSSVIEELARRGYTCHEEIAREVIRENLDNKVDVFPWNQMRAFSDQVFGRMVDLVASFQKEKICFLDRSIVDLIGYMKFANAPVPSKYMQEAMQVGYSPKVFFMPMWNDIYSMDEERKESINEAQLIGDALFDAYQELGFELIEVPRVSISNRADFILENCSTLE